MRSLETLVRQQECEAERNADSIREYLQQIDALQVGQGSAEHLVSVLYFVQGVLL